MIGPLPAGAHAFIDDISPDGKYALYFQDKLYAVPLSPDQGPAWLIEPSEYTFLGMFSPDGKWVVYMAGNPTQTQIFVQRFPNAGPRKQISSGGSSMPVWRADGKEILYLGADNQIWSVPVDLARGEFGAATPLFPVKAPPLTRVTRIYAATRDGSRIVFNQLVGQPESKVIDVAIDWETGLRK